MDIFSQAVLGAADENNCTYPSGYMPRQVLIGQAKLFMALLTLALRNFFSYLLEYFSIMLMPLWLAPVAAAACMNAKTVLGKNLVL